MNETEKMRAMLQQLKNEAQTFLDNNQVEEAENKTLEVKILNAQIEIQEKLDVANKTIEDLNNSTLIKDETITTLQADLETVKNEKQEVEKDFKDATEKLIDLNANIKEMKPVVDKYNEEQYNNKLNSAKEIYKARFEKVDGLEAFKSEEIQNLIADSISDDESVSEKAENSLSKKIFDLFDRQDKSNLSVSSIQEPLKDTKNLNPDSDDFESTYGFKKE